MPVCDEGRYIVVFAGRDGGGRGAGEEGRQREEVAGSRGAVRYEGEELGDQALLDGCFLLLLTFAIFLGGGLDVPAAYRTSSAAAARNY